VVQILQASAQPGRGSSHHQLHGRARGTTGAGVYARTKFGVTAFAESLRQALLKRRVRVSVVEPGTVDSELVSHLGEDMREAARRQVESIEPLRPEDIADAVSYIVTRVRRVAVNEMLVPVAEQHW
jgi:NADP-dependent 3-hydroxy acid dehydrogenase YdfG